MRPWSNGSWTFGEGRPPGSSQIIPGGSPAGIYDGTRAGKIVRLFLVKMEDDIPIMRLMIYIMLLKQCHVYHPQVIIIFMGGMFTIKNVMVKMAFVLPRGFRRDHGENVANVGRGLPTMPDVHPRFPLRVITRL